jgi:phosphoglycerate kinase
MASDCSAISLFAIVDSMKALAKHLNEVTKKKVIVRCNFDVPYDQGSVADTTRIEDALPTLKKLLDQDNSLLLMAHTGRPDGTYNQDYSLAPVKKVLDHLLARPINLIDYQQDYRQLSLFDENPLSLLENLRFWPQEEAADKEFAAFLTKDADYFINESFATAHRSHASTTVMPTLIKSYAGLAFENEVNALNKVAFSPAKPLVLVMGGAKLETKEPLIKTLESKADYILIGGKIALDLTQHPTPYASKVKVAKLTKSGKDITPASAQEFAEIILEAGTVIWNGTMGVFEENEHRLGTQIVAKAVAETDAFTLVGGGDTEAALTILNLDSSIDHLSTGGGAMLTYLASGSLPALKVL